ncbi:MAG: hypothetical protein IKX44_06140 [Prevotella sp.]|nr:hypothetical protein [Prevotella sp.]
MNPIGGYFSLELPLHEEYHKEAIKLNTGRNCLEYILRSRKYSKVYIPYYSCDVLLEPFRKLGIEYTFYRINIEFEIAEVIALKENEALLYINYFGLKQNYVSSLAGEYSSQLIVDNTQAFYAKPIEGIDTFYTCRKFFGVPDGAYLYTDHPLDDDIEQDVSWERMDFLTKRIDLSPEDGYSDFRQQSHDLIGQRIKRMSRLTERFMQSIGYDAVAARRRDNFNCLHKHLSESNQLHLSFNDDAVPMIYPYLTSKEGLREYLIQNKVFVAKYWPNVLELSNFKTEYELANKVVAIPCDQRYEKDEMLFILKTIDLWK